MVDVLEKRGSGLNLTDATRDGVLRHSKPTSHIEGEVAGRPSTAEGQVVKIADGIAYISHDLDDAVGAGLLSDSYLPPSVASTLGASHSQRIDTLVRSVVRSSTHLVGEPVADRQVIEMEPEVLGAADELRTFLFHELYEPINDLPSTRHAREIVVRLFEYYRDEGGPDCSPANRHDWRATTDQQAADVVSGMTDDFARRTYDELFVPRFEEI